MPTLTADQLEQIPKQKLIHMLKRGTVTIMLAPTMTNQFAHLEGIRIHVSEAARKYNIPNPTISRWAKKGYIKILGKIGNKTMLNEADVARCADVYQERGGQGRWLFNPDGSPYFPKD